MANLTSLYLQNNGLQHLPESFGNLKQLEDLYLSTNNLATLPASIVRLTQLRNLYLDHNPQLTVSDDKLRWMAELEQKGCFIQTDFERPKPEKKPKPQPVKVETVAEPIKKTKKKNWFQRIFKK